MCWLSHSAEHTGRIGGGRIYKYGSAMLCPEDVLASNSHSHSPATLQLSVCKHEKEPFQLSSSPRLCVTALASSDVFPCTVRQVRQDHLEGLRPAHCRRQEKCPRQPVVHLPTSRTAAQEEFLIYGVVLLTAREWRCALPSCRSRPACRGMSLNIFDIHSLVFTDWNDLWRNQPSASSTAFQRIACKMRLGLGPPWRLNFLH